jgi:hypothetical protein
MKKAMVSVLVFACLFFATSCDNGSGNATDTPSNDADAPAETAITATLDTASGSAIPAQFNATITWSIKDSEWKSDDSYVAQAYFAGTDGKPIAVGSPFAFQKTKSGKGTYEFKIPEAGLPATVKKPYELTIVVNKGDAVFWTSAAWTFTEGNISGTYTGTLNYYTAFDPVTGKPTKGDSYDYRATLNQYGAMVTATNIYYLYDSDNDDVNDKESLQQCTVVMAASTTAGGKTKLTGAGTFTNGSGVTTNYSGEAYVFGDNRTISCDAYWLSTDAAKKSTGSFNAELKGTASISGKVTINLNGQTPIFTSTDPHDEDCCYAVVLYGFGEGDIEDNAGRMSLGPVETDGTAYWYTYKIPDLPAGNYYLMFGGIDGDLGVAEADRNHMPWSTGEAVGLAGLDPAMAVRWIDGDTAQDVKDAVSAIVPITVKDGDALTGKDFGAIVRSKDKL